MQFKRPENTEKYYWTRHSIGKMMQYGLSAQRITRVIRAPERIIEGVAKNTIAVMQPSSMRRGDDGKKIWSQEIWAMYQMRGKNEKRKMKKAENGNIVSNVGNKIENNFDKLNGFNLIKSQIKIISAWRYPGVSPKGDSLPEEILNEIAEAGL